MLSWHAEDTMELFPGQNHILAKTYMWYGFVKMVLRRNYVFVYIFMHYYVLELARHQECWMHWTWRFRYLVIGIFVDSNRISPWRGSYINFHLRAAVSGFRTIFAWYSFPWKLKNWNKKKKAKSIIWGLMMNPLKSHQNLIVSYKLKQ